MAVTRTKTASANEVVGLILDQIGRFGREPVDAGRAGERATYLANSLSGQTERAARRPTRSEEHTSELQSLMRISYAVFCLKKKSATITNDKKRQLIVERTILQY